MNIMHITQVIIVVLIASFVKSETQNDKSQIPDSVLERALSDQRYLARQLRCTTGEGPCDLVGKRIKSLAPLVLRGSCPQCSPQETKQIQRVLAYVQKNFPKEWNKILQRYATG